PVLRPARLRDGRAPRGGTGGAARRRGARDDVRRRARADRRRERGRPKRREGAAAVRVRSDVTDADPEKLHALAKELSYMSGGVTLALGIEDGAVVRYNLFDRGSSVDEYASVPEYRGELPPGDVIALGANPTVVARLTGADPHHVREVARTAASPGELPPAEDLYRQIATLMGVTA